MSVVTYDAVLPLFLKRNALQESRIVSIETVRNIPEHLPPARLFLDDVDEITNILFEARKASGESALPVKYTVKGKFICDALSDLKTLGGAVTEFEVRVGNNRLSLSSPWCKSGFVSKNI